MPPAVAVLSLCCRGAVIYHRGAAVGLLRRCYYVVAMPSLCWGAWRDGVDTASRTRRRQYR